MFTTAVCRPQDAVGAEVCLSGLGCRMCALLCFLWQGFLTKRLPGWQHMLFQKLYLPFNMNGVIAGVLHMPPQVLALELCADNHFSSSFSPKDILPKLCEMWTRLTTNTHFVSVHLWWTQHLSVGLGLCCSTTWGISVGPFILKPVWILRIFWYLWAVKSLNFL